MRTSILSSILACFMCLAPAAYAQRVLSRAEILEILNTLADQPRETWIPAGTIQATHEEYGAPQVTDPQAVSRAVQQALDSHQDNLAWTPEMQQMARDAIPFNVRYKLANEYTMSSNVIVRYDGDRFYWEINVTKRRDSVTRDAALAGNFLTDEFNLAWNQQRIFTWDGQKYTTYGSGGQATEDTADRFPRVVKGPLTAGLVPWGCGKLQQADLTAAEISAQEVSLNGTTSVEMSITHADGSASHLSLDPAKAYAVTSANLEGQDNRTTTYTCAGYQSVGGAWVPSSVSIKKLDRTTGRLLRSDEWTFTSISGAAPALDSFMTPYALDTVVESVSPVDADTSICFYTPTANTDELLARRLAYVAAHGRRPQNCATAALEYVASSFGKTVPAGTGTALVGADGRTSLAQLQQAAQASGLYTRAVTTDLAGLRNLGGIKAILYLPGTRHFVVLHEVDDRYVRLIDPSSRKFFYGQSADFFPTEWTGGAALLLSDRPIAGPFSDLPEATRAGASGGYYWSCTKLYQNDFVIYCSAEPIYCSGAVAIYFKRYVCEIAPSGTCTNSAMLRKQTSPCIIDEWSGCTITGEWHFYYMWACQ